MRPNVSQPVWETENRGWTHEEAEKFKEEVARLGRSKSKVADMAAANESGNGIVKYNNSNNNIECQD
jgi:hypothetical protein